MILLHSNLPQYCLKPKWFCCIPIFHNILWNLNDFVTNRPRYSQTWRGCINSTPNRSNLSSNEEKIIVKSKKVCLFSKTCFSWQKKNPILLKFIVGRIAKQFRLMDWWCPSVCLSVRLSVRPSVRLSTFWLTSAFKFVLGYINQYRLDTLHGNRP